ncbi:MAG: endo-1,4-beta-xylanase [Spirulina sp. SIO3F2]|nr:endo-1,4-beta-xylanase [Spirulina sp. SIO3F2]
MPPLRQLAPHYLIGSAVRAQSLATDPEYRHHLQANFNLLVPENSLKCQVVCQSPQQYNFAAADSIIQFAQANNQKVRGHTLCWHISVAKWMKQLNAHDLEITLRDYIQTTVGRYKGQCYAWDVVSEVITDRGLPRPSVWKKIEAFIPKCFQWAHEADPEAQLIYSDYRPHRIFRWNAICKMVSELKRAGIPIHGVGFQVHQEVFRNLGMSALRIAPLAKQLQKQGIAAHVAEISIPIYPPTQQLPQGAKYELQAKAYSQLLETALDAGCESFTVWGFSDRYAFYIPPRCDSRSTPCIMDADYQPKPAYGALQRVLQDRFSAVASS